MTPRARASSSRDTRDEFVAYLDELFAQRRADADATTSSARSCEAEDEGDHLSRERAVQHGRPPHRRRPRDDGEPHRERRRSALLSQSRAARRAPCGSGARCRRRSRSFCATTVPSSGRSRGGSPQMSSSAAGRSHAATSWSRSSARRTAMPTSSPIPPRSTSDARPRVSTSASDVGRTTASVRRSRASRRRSRSRRCSSGCRTSGSRSRRRTSTGGRSRSSAACLASSGVGSLDRSDRQRQPVDRTHDDSRPRVAPASQCALQISPFTFT